MNSRQVFEVPGIGELVEDGDVRPPAPRDEEPDEIGSDKPGSSGDEYLLHRRSPPAPGRAGTCSRSRVGLPKEWYLNPISFIVSGL